MFAYHGVNPEENKSGQIFFIDAFLEINKQPGSLDDNINKTISYSDINQVIIKTCTEKTYKLIETLGENIANNILDIFSEVKSVKIKVSKPNAPMRGIFKNVAVIIKKTK